MTKVSVKRNYKKSSRGGFRPGSGRPKKFYETKVMRVPEVLEKTFRQKISDFERTVMKIGAASPLTLPLYESRIQAGLPSPVEDSIEGEIDLNRYLVQHETTTFMVRATGESMKEAGIFPGDLLIVDRSLQAKSGKIILAFLDGEFTIKRLVKNNGKIFLYPENPSFKPIEVSHGQEFLIWGVVTNVIHSLS